MREWCGSARAISRNTVSPPTPESKTPIGAASGAIRAVRRHHRAAAFALDVVLLDLLVQIRARGIDGLGGLGDVPAVLAELGKDEGLLGFVLEILERGEAHGRGDDVGGGAEEFGRE